MDEEREVLSDHEFSDPDDYVDNISDEELLGDILKNRPCLDKSRETLVVVDHAPKVGPDRMDKLKTVLKKVLGRFGDIVSEYYPTDEKGIFKGFFFIEYSTPEEAQNAVRTCDGYKLDKSHIFAVNLLSDFQKYKHLPKEEWSPPQKVEFKEVGNLRSWLTEPDCHDQYVGIFNGGRVEKSAVCYNTPQEPRVVLERERWTETYHQWSPLGSYLISFHSQGVALWGTENFIRLGRFTHPGVQLADCSPCERYLVTLSNIVENASDPQNIIIWDIKTGKKKRTFTKLPTEDWPVIKWSFDGRYFARKSENVLSIYEVPGFGLLDKKSMLVKGIKDFAWSPHDHLISYWVPELNELPSKIFITRIPSRQEVCTKSRHLVSDCKLQWHKQGDYLCVKVDHWVNKSKKQLVCSFEIFHTRETEIPVDSIEIKDPIIDFSLEPNGNKFAIIHGVPPTRIFTSIYKINEKGTPPSNLKTFEKQVANTLFWSPAGQFIVLAGLKSMDGILDFIDTGDMSLMHRQEHTKVTDIFWDPTGRYVVSSVSYWAEKMDTGFIVWSFQGRLLHRSPRTMEKFCQFLWRPRPPSLLSEEDIKNIKKDFKKYQHIFEQKDRTIKTKASKGLLEKRRKQVDDFTAFRERKRQELEKKRVQERYSEYLKQMEIKLMQSKDIIEVNIKIKEKIEEING